MIAVIYYAYGAPKSLDDVEPYFTHILNGKKVPAPMLNNIVGMFKKPGTPDFIRSSTERIAKGLTTLLNGRLDEEVQVYTAYKHTGCSDSRCGGFCQCPYNIGTGYGKILF